MNPIDFATTVAKNGEGQSDRYLLIFVLTLGGIAIFLSVRWLVGRLERQTELLSGLFKEANDARQKCSEAYATGTEVIRECKDTICECKETMQECTDFLKRKIT